MKTWTTQRPLAGRALAVATFTMATLALGACETPEAGTWLTGESLINTRLVLTSTTQGIHPSTDVLDNPHNPFRFSPPSDDLKWVLAESGNNAAAFYGWATRLATEPNGEHQFYAARFLKGIYDNGEVSDAELPYVREMALGAFQSQLDNFPDAVTFDTSGTIAYELATPAVQAMRELGSGARGWVLVQQADGSEIAVQGGVNVVLEETDK